LPLEDRDPDDPLVSLLLGAELVPGVASGSRSSCGETSVGAGKAVPGVTTAGAGVTTAGATPSTGTSEITEPPL
jgi:hypothetical protein